jgi:hypothetical protein
MLGGLVSFLRYLCVFAYSSELCVCFVFLRPVYPMLPVFLDCPFLIAPSVISNVHWLSEKYIVTSIKL